MNRFILGRFEFPVFNIHLVSTYQFETHDESKSVSKYMHLNITTWSFGSDKNDCHLEKLLQKVLFYSNTYAARLPGHVNEMWMLPEQMIEVLFASQKPWCVTVSQCCLLTRTSQNVPLHNDLNSLTSEGNCN